MIKSRRRRQWATFSCWPNSPSEIKSSKVHPHYHVLTTAGLFLPDGSFYSVSDLDEADLTARLRRSVLSSLVRRNLLLPENAATMQSWPLERSGFNVHVGPVVQGEDRERLRGLVRYVMRAPLSLKRLDYNEASGQVRYRSSHGDVKTWPHAIHFLADLAQHIPKARQQTVSYHGWFANPTGHLSRRQEKVEKAPNRRGRWAAGVLRVWQVDPELCPRCGKRMSRSRAVLERLELVKLLTALGRFGYPPRPPPRPPEPLEPDISYDSPAPDECSQIPEHWDITSQLPLDW